MTGIDALLTVCSALLIVRAIDLKRKRRCAWEKEWLKRRRTIGVYHSLIREIRTFQYITRQTCQHWPGARPMLYTKSARCWQNILARHRLHSGAILAQYRHFVICRNDAVMRPVYIKQHWLYTGKAASAQYRPITLQYRPDAGPMLYAELARCWQSILARHWPSTVCIAARHWPYAGITL